MLAMRNVNQSFNGASNNKTKAKVLELPSLYWHALLNWKLYFPDRADSKVFISQGAAFLILRQERIALPLVRVLPFMHCVHSARLQLLCTVALAALAFR